MVSFTIFIKYFKDIFFILYLNILVLPLDTFFFVKVYILYNYYFIIRGNLNTVKVG